MNRPTAPRHPIRSNPCPRQEANVQRTVWETAAKLVLAPEIAGLHSKLYLAMTS